MSDPIKTYCELGEGEIPIRVVEVIEYLDADGKVKWSGRHHGCDTWSILFGVMEALQHRLHRHRGGMNNHG